MGAKSGRKWSKLVVKRQRPSDSIRAQWAVNKGGQRPNGGGQNMVGNAVVRRDQRLNGGGQAHPLTNVAVKRSGQTQRSNRVPGECTKSNIAGQT
jgi:hypothetical protein